MSAPSVRLLTLLTLFANPAFAEVCIDGGPTCAVYFAFGKAFERVGFLRPSDAGWPQLYQDGGRPVVRYAYNIAIDDRFSTDFAHDDVRLADSVSSFSGAVKAKLCADVSTAGFVTAGGIVEFWIRLGRDWQYNETDVDGWPDKILFRIETCEAP
jgi:hypothetical protein